MLAPFVGYAQVAMAFGIYSLAIGGSAFGYEILAHRVPFPFNIGASIQYLTFAIVGAACVVGGFAPDVDWYAFALLPFALAALAPFAGGSSGVRQAFTRSWWVWLPRYRWRWQFSSRSAMGD